jgi:hypothetical protein
MDEPSSRQILGTGGVSGKILRQSENSLLIPAEMETPCLTDT